MKLKLIALLISQFVTSFSVISLELESSIAIKVAKNPNSLAIADLDKDGINEIIISSQQDGIISVYKIKSRNKKVASAFFNGGINPTDLSVEDMNKDGFLDLVIANHESSNFRVLLNDGTGSFEDENALVYPVKTSPHIHTLGVGDFNQDKVNDVVIDSWGSSEVSVYYLDSKSGFKGKPTTIEVKQQPRTNLVVADLDGDSLPDIITPGTRFGGVTIVFGKSLNAPVFIETSVSPFYVSVADTNLDGHQDIISVHRNGNYRDKNDEAISLLLGNGKGHFELATNFPMALSGAPSSVSAGDLDGDGLIEIVTANYRTNSVTVIYKKTLKDAYRAINFSVGSRPLAVVVEDIDGDSVDEVVVANSESNDISILKFMKVD